MNYEAALQGNETELYYAQSLGWRNGIIDAQMGLESQTTIDCGASTWNPWHVAYSRGYLAGWTLRSEQLRALRSGFPYGMCSP